MIFPGTHLSSGLLSVSYYMLVDLVESLSSLLELGSPSEFWLRAFNRLERVAGVRT
jgi:hypothetical protein